MKAKPVILAPRPASVAAATGQRSAGLDRDSVQSKLMQHVRNVLTEDERLGQVQPDMTVAKGRGCSSGWI